MRRGSALIGLLATGVLVTGFATAVPAGEATAAALPAVAGHLHQGPRGPIRVGRLALRPCSVVPGAYCGSLPRPWDSSGQVPGTVGVGFAFVPARDATQPALGT